jgi:glutathione S-transferase
MVLKLYGYPISAGTLRVATVLHEKKVPFELIPIDLFKREQKSPEFVKNQPFGQVPYIDDDGFILYESRAICYYIAAKYPDTGDRLIPADLKAHARFQQAASVELAHFTQYAEKAVAEMIFKPMRGMTSDKATFDQLIADLSTRLDVYDQILSKQKYLAGDEITLADLYHLPGAHMLPKTGSNIMEEKPNVARWYKDISSRPSWQAVKDGFTSTA